MSENEVMHPGQLCTRDVQGGDTANAAKSERGQYRPRVATVE